MWIAIDRSTVNRSLLLDYLERLDTHPLANSITTVAATQENLRWEHLYGLRFGPPELSFSESVVTSGRVGWSCRANAGVQLTVDQPGGASKRIVKIESYSPLQGPRLVARTTLKEISVAPQTAAKVLLDVAAGDGYLFGFAETEEAQRAGATAWRKSSGLLPPAATMLLSAACPTAAWIFSRLPRFDHGRSLRLEQKVSKAVAECCSTWPSTAAKQARFQETGVTGCIPFLRATALRWS